MAYFRKRYHAPGTPPGTFVEHPNIARHPLRITLVDYDSTNLEKRDEVTVEEIGAYLASPTVTWVHVQGYADLDTMQRLASSFDIHPLALEDVINQGQRPKLESFERQLFITLGLPAFEQARVEVEQVSFFLGPGYVLSFHQGADNPFDPVCRRLETPSRRMRGAGADYLLYALMDRIVDQGFPVLERFGETVEDVEVELLDDPDHETLARIHELKRDLLLLRRMLWPERDIVNQLLRDDHALIKDETKVYLRDIYDHSIQIMDLLETYRDMSAAMLDVYLSSVSHRLNDVMRVLTIISTVFIPMTFIAGLYGMNFHNPDSPWAMPELAWYYGYPLVLAVMIAIGAGMLVFFKRKRWL